MDSKRIWELDALRGIAILGVVVIHLFYDLQLFWNIDLLSLPVLRPIGRYGGVVFVILSGLCVTLGSRSLRRGAQVFACGMAITAVTVLLARFRLVPQSVVIRFGVLHLLGICMLLWPLFRPAPVWALTVLGATVVALGLWFAGLRVDSPWLFPFGLIRRDFSSADYFPLCPHLGWFLLGAALGKTLYCQKRTLLPRVSPDTAPVRFFSRCGRKSLLIYLLHQPILYGIMTIAASL